MPTLLSQQVDQFTMIVEDHYKAIETHETLVTYVRQQLEKSAQGQSVDAHSVSINSELSLLDQNLQSALHHSTEELKRTQLLVKSFGKELMNGFIDTGCSREQLKYLTEGIEKCAQKEYLQRNWIALVSFLRTAAVCSLQSVPIPGHQHETGDVGADTSYWIESGTEDY